MYSLSPTQQSGSASPLICIIGIREPEISERESLGLLPGDGSLYHRSSGEGRGWKLSLPVSSSPEIHDDEAASWVTPNSNYDLALLRYLYQTLAEYAGAEPGRKRGQALERDPGRASGSGG